MSFYKEVPGRKTTLESVLKFDIAPTEGSTDPVTSEGVKSAIDGAVGDSSAALQEQIDEIAEKAGSGYIPKGEASVATLNGLSGQENGDLYTMTDAGTLTEGSLAVVAGDTVAWDEANSVWYKAMDYAPRQYGTNEVHNLTTSITAFRTGDVIPVDGPSGTAKMSKDSLLKILALNSFKSCGNIPSAATSIDTLDEGFYIIPSYQVPYITDLPSMPATSKPILVFTYVLVTGLKTQIIVTNDDDTHFVFIRKIFNGTPFRWVEIGGYIGSELPSSVTSLAGIGEGAFYVAPANASTTTDLPDELKTSTQRIPVFSYSIGSYQGNEIYLQVIQTLDPNNNKIYIRRVYGSTPSSWKEIGNSYSATELPSSVTSLAGIGEGAFYVAPANASTTTDLPDELKTSTQRIPVFSYHIGNFYGKPIYLQTITTLDPSDNKTYSRRVYGGTGSSWVKFGSIETDTRWAALGDSITRGVYSTDPDTRLFSDKGYPYWVGKYNGYATTNYGVSGAGYVRHPEESPLHEDTYNAKEKVDVIDFSDYDLVTLAYGTNDYKFDYPLGNVQTSTSGDGSVVGNLKYCIEKIQTDNPLAKIILILPNNRSDVGTKASRWALDTYNSASTAYTLQDLIDAEKAVADLYCIQSISETEDFLVNLDNISYCFPDGRHPSLECYKVIGKILAKRIMFQ